MTLTEKAELIINDIKKETGTNPVRIFKNIAKKEYISMHGPEHHVLDGASILVAYKNAGGSIDLDLALEKLMQEGLRMPGAMCGLWGICGAITSVGAALAIIDGTGPLSTDGTWGNHMQFTSDAIGELGDINGPRCCKRDAMIAFKNGIKYVNEHYGVTLVYEYLKCEYSGKNEQCIKERCPYYEQYPVIHSIHEVEDEMYMNEVYAPPQWMEDNPKHETPNRSTDLGDTLQFCSGCGHPYSMNKRFCPFCGRKSAIFVNYGEQREKGENENPSFKPIGMLYASPEVMERSLEKKTGVMGKLFKRK